MLGISYSGQKGALMLFANPRGLEQARRLDERCQECGWDRDVARRLCPFGRWPEKCEQNQ